MAFPYVPNYGGNWQTGVAGATPITEAALDNLETQFQSVIDLLTIRGDLPYRGVATWERLAKGTSGQFLSCDANDPVWVDDPTPDIIRKTADQTVNNSVVLVNDTHLFFPVGANEIWEFVMLLRMTTPSINPDLKWSFTIPGGSIISFAIYDGATPNIEVDSTAIITQQLGAGQSNYTWWRLLYIGAAPAGNVQLQWAQNAAIAENTVMRINSFIVAHQLV